jgi:putative DNA primase/helicase
VKCRGGWKARCPAHDDSTPSLDMKVESDGKVLVICRSQGCSFSAIAAALGLQEADFFPHGIVPAKSKAKRRTDFVHPVAIYLYENPDGSPRFQVRRFNVFEDGLVVDKDFRQYRPVGSDWVAGLGDVEPILYRLPELLAADIKRPVTILEGEKDVDNVRAFGRVATCNPMGAGKWRDHFCESLRGRECWIIPDNDQAGRDHAQQVARSLLGIAASVKIVDLIQLTPDLKVKGDVSDFLDAGGTLSEVEELARGIPTFDKATVLTVLEAPTAHEVEEEDWPELCMEEPPKALPFPVEVFPVALQRFCTGVAQVTLSPVDLAGAAMLAVASAAIGQSAHIWLKRTWRESPLLYVVIVADPGSKKSPAIKLVARPLTSIDAVLRKTSKDSRDLWEAMKKALPKGETAGEEPPQRRAIVKDVTRETLAAILRDNPRGVLANPDEATAWVSSFNEYKAKGADREFWLSIWGDGSISVDREGGRRSIYVKTPLVTVIAGIPSDMVDSLNEQHGRNDGFRDRILFVYPEQFPDQEWTEDELDQGDEMTWAHIIATLHAQEMFRETSGEIRPHLVEFEKEAKAAFITWFNAHNKETQGDVLPAACKSIWSKLEAYCARFILILSRLRVVMDPECRDPLKPPVVLGDVQGAIKLLDYFKANAKRVLHHLTGGTFDPDAKAVLGWIGRNDKTEFTIRDLRNDMPGRFPTPESASHAVAVLARIGIVRIKSPLIKSSKGGRKPSPTYDVHPDLLTS